MQSQTRAYVGATVVLAGILTATLYAFDPILPANGLKSVVLLGSLALMAELLGYLLSKSVVGSIAVIPYLAMVLTIGNWLAPIAVVAVRIISEVRTKSPIKALFNVAQHGAAAAFAVLAFRLLGGTPIALLHDKSLYEATATSGLQALIAIFASYLINGILVSGVIGVSSGKNAVEVWKEWIRRPIAFDIMGAPVIFLFSWVYAHWGPMAALGAWVPVLGLRQVHKTNMDLEQTNRELLELMVKSIEARDPYTSGHSRRVHHYSVIIARALQLKARQIEQIGHAALLHDIGKIHEKYAPILRKADKLTPEEWQIMQQHSVDGAELIATMSGLKELVPSVRHHHEKWNGTGYPDGLAGEAIPMAARIIAFADTIDAMTSERPYRRPLGSEDVRKELLRCRGLQFDPAITDRLLASPTWIQLFGPPADIERNARASLSIVGKGTPRELTG